MKFILKKLIQHGFSIFEELNSEERSKARYILCDPIREKEIEEHHFEVRALVMPIFTKDLSFKELLRIRRQLKVEIQLSEECLNQPTGR